MKAVFIFVIFVTILVVTVRCTASTDVDLNEKTISSHSSRARLHRPLRIRPEPPERCLCPVEHKVNINVCAMDGMKRRLLINVWENKSSDFKGVQRFLKNTVLNMIDSDSSEWRDVSFVCSVWLAGYLPYASKMPSLCTFAQIINATVAWGQSKDSKAILEAIDEVALSLIESVIAAGNYAIGEAGCTAPITKFRNNACYKDGSIFEIDQIWEHDGGIMPCPKATKVLYGSTLYADRLLATLASASISHPFRDIVLNLDNELLYKFVELTTNNSPIPTCCCKSHIERINQFHAAFGHEVSRSADEIKAKYSKRWDKKSILPVI